MATGAAAAASISQPVLPSVLDGSGSGAEIGVVGSGISGGVVAASVASSDMVVTFSAAAAPSSVGRQPSSTLPPARPAASTTTAAGTAGGQAVRSQSVMTAGVRRFSDAAAGGGVGGGGGGGGGGAAHASGQVVPSQSSRRASIATEVLAKGGSSRSRSHRTATIGAATAAGAGGVGGGSRTSRSLRKTASSSLAGRTNPRGGGDNRSTSGFGGSRGMVMSSGLSMGGGSFKAGVDRSSIVGGGSGGGGGGGIERPSQGSTVDGKGGGAAVVVSFDDDGAMPWWWGRWWGARRAFEEAELEAAFRASKGRSARRTVVWGVLASLAVMTIVYAVFEGWGPGAANTWAANFSDDEKAAGAGVAACPEGWFCMACDPDGSCGSYSPTKDLLMWSLGVALPSSLFLVLLRLLPDASLGRWVDLFGAVYVAWVVCIGVHVRYLFVNPYANQATRGFLALSAQAALTAMVRSGGAEAAAMGLVIAVVGLATSWVGAAQGAAAFGGARVPVSVSAALMFTVAAVAVSLGIGWLRAGVERAARAGFGERWGLGRDNRLLRKQLRTLVDRQAEARARLELDSPLERAIVVLRALMGDAVCTDAQVAGLAEVMRLLTSGNLLTPEIDGQAAHEALDTEQQNWLFTEIMPRAGAGPAIPGPMANQPRRRSHARNYDSLLRTVGGPGGGGSSSTEGGGTAGGGSAAGARLTSIVSIDNGSAPDGGLGLGVASPAMDRSWQKSDSGAGSVMASAPLPSSPVLGRRGTARSGASERAPPGSSAAISDSGGGANGWAPMITVALASAKGRSDPGSAVQLQTGATVVSEPGVIGNGGPAAAAAREAALVEWDSYEWGGVFELAVATGGRPLSALWWHLLSVAPSPTAAGFGGGSEHGGVAKTIAQQLGLDVERAWRFAVEIERGYHADLPYHNSTHAADVLHCMAVFSRMPAVTRAIQPQPPSPAPSPLLSLGTPASAPSATATPLDVLAMYVAAAIHDYDHPGLNNNFLMTTGDPKAVLYNDRSILENHHLASGFAVLSRPEFNFLSHLSSSEYKPFRETVIEMVLATDLSQHFSLISVFKTKLAQNTFNPAESREDRILLQRMLMKIADVSNPAKPWPIYARWCARVLEEFARQGDRERALGLPISPYMDRTSLNVPSSQIGFLDFVIAPLFEAYDRFDPIPRILGQLRRNKQHWVNLKNAGVVNLVDVVSPEQFAASTGVEPLRLPGDEDTVSVAVETASTAGAAGQSASSASQTRARIGGGWASGSLRQLAPATPQVSLTAPTGGGGGGGGMWASRFALPRGDNTDSTHGR